MAYTNEKVYIKDRFTYELLDPVTSFDAVKDASGNSLDERMGNTLNHGLDTSTGYTLTENDTHVWTNISTLNISSLSNPNGDYLVKFNTVADASINITLPSNIKWNVNPIFFNNRTYYLGMTMGCGFFSEFVN